MAPRPYPKAKRGFLRDKPEDGKDGRGGSLKMVSWRQVRDWISRNPTLYVGYHRMIADVTRLPSEFAPRVAVFNSHDYLLEIPSRHLKVFESRASHTLSKNAGISKAGLELFGPSSIELPLHRFYEESYDRTSNHYKRMFFIIGRTKGQKAIFKLALGKVRQKNKIKAREFEEGLALLSEMQDTVSALTSIPRYTRVRTGLLSPPASVSELSALGSYVPLSPPPKPKLKPKPVKHVSQAKYLPITPPKTPACRGVVLDFVLNAPEKEAVAEIQKVKKVRQLNRPLKRRGMTFYLSNDKPICSARDPAPAPIISRLKLSFETPKPSLVKQEKQKALPLKLTNRATEVSHSRDMHSTPPYPTDQPSVSSCRLTMNSPVRDEEFYVGFFWDSIGDDLSPTVQLASSKSVTLKPFKAASPPPPPTPLSMKEQTGNSMSVDQESSSPLPTPCSPITLPKSPIRITTGDLTLAAPYPNYSIHNRLPIIEPESRPASRLDPDASAATPVVATPCLSRSISDVISRIEYSSQIECNLKSTLPLQTSMKNKLLKLCLEAPEFIPRTWVPSYAETRKNVDLAPVIDGNAVSESTTPRLYRILAMTPRKSRYLP